MIQGELTYPDLLDTTKVDNRPVCVKCSKNTGQIIRFSAKRNGVYIPYGNESAISGDLWICPICNSEIIKGFGDRMEKPISSQVLKSKHSILHGVRDDFF
jgi:hypothetical protein